SADRRGSPQSGWPSLRYRGRPQHAWLRPREDRFPWMTWVTFPPLEKHWFGEALATRLAMLRSIWLMGNAPPTEHDGLGGATVKWRVASERTMRPRGCRRLALETPSF